MARKHRRVAAAPLSDVSRLANGGAREEHRAGRSWFVRDVSAQRAQKTYRCPECHGDIPSGQAHVVAWHADSFFGDSAALGERRHFHSHCWRLLS